MYVDFAKTSGGYVCETLSVHQGVIIPRIGEKVYLNGNNWIVEDVYHVIEESKVIIYLDQNY